MMPQQPRVLAFDLDPDSLVTVHEAFPEWQIETIAGVTSGSLDRDWNPSTAELLIVGARDQVGETLGLCRGLRSQVGRAHTPLLVLVPPAREPLVRAALDAGADSCLVLPVHAKELASALSRLHRGKRPGRHTLGLDRARRKDDWRDHGGEA
jgi:DNA-binding response OmpR family regulator